MAIKQIGIVTGGNKVNFIANGTTAEALAELNTNYLDVGAGSSCLMKETKEVAFFDGAMWFIW